MGWHMDMTYEEMEKEFGAGAGSGTPPGESEGPNEGDSDAKPTACPLPTNPDGSVSSKPPAPPEEHKRVYHLCRKQDWEESKESQNPYFPRTFLTDGKFTRASLYLDDIADVANEYYWKASAPDEEWIVLEMDVQFLYHVLGIPVMAAIAPESVTDHNGGGDANSNTLVECLKIFGGVSTHPKILESLVTAVYFMKRRDVDGKFIGMLASCEESIESGSPSAKVEKTTLKVTTDNDEKEVDDIMEIATDDVNGSYDEIKNTTKTKKKKKGLFSKLKTKKKSATSAGV